MDSIEPGKPKRQQKSVERAVIHDGSLKKLVAFKAQIESNLGEYIKVNFTDLVNLLIESHGEDLTADEINLVKLRKYDQVKHIRWVLAKAQEARRRGDVLNVAGDLGGALDTPKPALKKQRRSKKLKAVEIGLAEESAKIDNSSLENAPKI